MAKSTELPEGFQAKKKRLPPHVLVMSSRVLTENRANTLECARTRRRSSKRSEPAMPWRTSLTGSADWSDRYGAENREDLETRAREGPRRSLRG